MVRSSPLEVTKRKLFTTGSIFISVGEILLSTAVLSIVGEEPLYRKRTIKWKYSDPPRRIRSNVVSATCH